MSPAMLFLLKVTVTPVLVAAVSLAARWWGPTVGGILMGLPWFTGPVLFILVQDKGIDFGEAACIGILLGVVCISVFILVYGRVARFARWPTSLASAVALYAVSAWAAQGPELLPALTPHNTSPLAVAAAAGALSLALTGLLLPRPRTASLPQALPWWDIPVRMLATGSMVAGLLLAAETLGPRLSGIFASYPVILTVVGTFTHHRWGSDAVARVLRGITVSLFSFVVFFLVVGLGLPAVGSVGAFALASGVALVMTGSLLALRRP
jgi:hypothetical protein